VQQILAKQYQVTPIDISKGKSVPDDIAALVVMAPTTKFSEPDKYHIDQYIMHGGRVAFLLNKVDATLQNRFGRALDLNLDDLLDNYGLRINADLIRDAQCANISIVQQQFGFNIQSQVPFPFLPLVSNVNKNNMIVKDLKGVVLFFVSSIDTTRLAAKNLTGEILMRSSNQTGRQANVFMFDPLARYTREEFSEKEVPLAAVVHGKFKSAFANKPVPVDTSAGAIAPSGNTITESPDSRIILVGDGDFARDQFVGGRDNLTFFANMIDYLVDDAGLITIRSKDVAMPPLEQVSDGTKKVLKYANLTVPPLLVLGYGLIRWRMRKARKKAMETQ
jgi:gliding-associated putative ABC transporter substrate-binding component GldG